MLNGSVTSKGKAARKRFCFSFVTKSYYSYARYPILCKKKYDKQGSALLAWLFKSAWWILRKNLQSHKNWLDFGQKFSRQNFWLDSAQFFSSQNSWLDSAQEFYAQMTCLDFTKKIKFKILGQTFLDMTC